VYEIELDGGDLTVGRLSEMTATCRRYDDFMVIHET
jgi:hypothetical protein